MATQFKGVRLSPRLRRTCALAWHERRSFADIAAIQGIAIRTVEWRVHRARRLLAVAGIQAPDGRRRARRAPAFQLSGIESV